VDGGLDERVSGLGGWKGGGRGLEGYRPCKLVPIF